MGLVGVGGIVVGAGCVVWIPAFAGMTGVGWLRVGVMVVGASCLGWIPAFAGMTGVGWLRVGVMVVGASCLGWIPAFAGMTGVGRVCIRIHPHPGPLPEGEGIGQPTHTRSHHLNNQPTPSVIPAKAGIHTRRPAPTTNSTTSNPLQPPTTMVSYLPDSNPRIGKETLNQ